MAGKYADKTSVSVANSQQELQRVLARWGATAFAFGWNTDKAQVEFAARDRRVRFTLTMPRRDDPEFTERRINQSSYTERRTPAQAEAAWEQACRSNWRALLLVVKAKLEAVEVGISTFEAEFLAHVVLPDGSTVYETLAPQIAESYRTGVMPPLLALGR